MLKNAADAKAAMKGIGESMKAAAAMAAGGGLAFSFKHAFGDGAELAHEIQGMRNAGRTAHEVAEGIEAATNAIAKLAFRPIPPHSDHGVGELPMAPRPGQYATWLGG